MFFFAFVCPEGAEQFCFLHLGFIARCSIITDFTASEIMRNLVENGWAPAKAIDACRTALLVRFCAHLRFALELQAGA